MIDLGVVGSVEEGRAALVDAAARFLLAGGVVTWADWCDMGADVRDAFEAAQARVVVEKAARDILVTSGVKGEARTSQRVSRALDEAAQRAVRL